MAQNKLIWEGNWWGWNERLPIKMSKRNNEFTIILQPFSSSPLVFRSETCESKAILRVIAMDFGFVTRKNWLKSGLTKDL
jgi:hypothetical protein